MKCDNQQKPQKFAIAKKSLDKIESEFSRSPKTKLEFL